MVSKMNEKLAFLRNTVSGVTALLPREYLEHPIYKDFLVEVDSDKPEVLSQPYTVDDNGERTVIQDSTESK